LYVALATALGRAPLAVEIAWMVVFFMTEIGEE
jgi:hypothetical protein